MTKTSLLPSILNLTVVKADLDHAICGAPTKCAIANTVRRQILPTPTFVKVRENRLTITWNGMIHHYEMTGVALKLVAQNDDGSLEMMPGASHRLSLRRTYVREAYTFTPTRRAAMKASNKVRAAAGRRYPNTRGLAAKAAGVVLKKLRNAKKP